MIALTVDNRNLVELEDYHISRIAALKHGIAERDRQIELLTKQLEEADSQCQIRDEIIHELRCLIG